MSQKCLNIYECDLLSFLFVLFALVELSIFLSISTSCIIYLLLGIYEFKAHQVALKYMPVYKRHLCHFSLSLLFSSVLYCSGNHVDVSSTV